MTEQQRRKAFQRIKSLTTEQFWVQMNVWHSAAYYKAEQHLREAMECVPGISAKKIEEVFTKAKEIRESWDGMTEIDIESTERDTFRMIVQGADNEKG